MDTEGKQVDLGLMAGLEQAPAASIGFTLTDQPHVEFVEAQPHDLVYSITQGVKWAVSHVAKRRVDP